ncbi:hypothetical protein DFJ74DRAFT_488467 [Hyaloraphidium curvatum]|nr:hypothetical protein DFJ74DRAFT_488467 [Hyaloraphidium curvatum]
MGGEEGEKGKKASNPFHFASRKWVRSNLPRPTGRSSTLRSLCALRDGLLAAFCGHLATWLPLFERPLPPALMLPTVIHFPRAKLKRPSTCCTLMRPLLEGCSWRGCRIPLDLHAPCWRSETTGAPVKWLAGPADASRGAHRRPGGRWRAPDACRWGPAFVSPVSSDPRRTPCWQTMEGENGAGSASPTAPAEDEGIASLLYKNRLSAHSLKPGAPVVFAHANSPRNKPGWMTTLDTMKEKEISNLNRDSLLSVWSRSEGTFVLSRTAISPDSGSGRKVLPRVPPRGPRLVPPTSSPPLASSPSPPSEGPLAQGGSSPLGHRSAALRSFDASESEGEEDGRDGAQQGLSPSGVEEVVEWDGTPAAEDAAGAPDGGAREESASPSVEEAFEDAEDAPQEPAGHPPVEHLEGRDVGSFPTDGRLLELSKSEAQFLQDLHQVREEIDEVLNQSEPGVPGRRQVPAGPSESDGQHPAPTMPAGSGNAEHLEPAQPAGREHPGPAALSRPEISPRYTVREISRLAAGLESELEALEEENGRLRAREAERDREAARIQEEARAETEGLRKRIAELEAEATQAQRAAEAERQTATGLREGAGRAEKLASELDSERAKQVELTGKVAQMEEQLERAASAVAEAQGERDRAAAQLQSERSGRAKLEDRVVELESELEKARSAASTAQKDRDRAARELRQAADAKDEAEQKLAQAEEAASTAQKDYDRALTQLRQAVEAVESRLAKETKERTRVEAVKRNAQQELRKTRSELKDSEENVRQLIRKREEAAKVGDTTPEAEEQHDGSGRAATSESSSLAQAASSSSADPPAVPATPTSSGRASPASATCASLPPALSGSSTSAGNLSLPTPTTTPVRTASELLNPKELVRADVKHAWNVCKKRHAQTDRARSESVSSLGTARPQRDTVTEVDFDALGRRFNAKW